MMSEELNLNPKMKFSFRHDLQHIIFCCEEFKSLKAEQAQLPIKCENDQSEFTAHLSDIWKRREAIFDSMCIRARRLVTHSARNNSKTSAIDPLGLLSKPTFATLKEWADKDIAHVNFLRRPVEEFEDGVGIQYFYPENQFSELKEVCEEALASPLIQIGPIDSIEGDETPCPST